MLNDENCIRRTIELFHLHSQDHGGDVTLKDNDGKTAINNAIIEKNYDLIPIFQNYVFEDKMQKRLCMRRKEIEKQSTPIRPLTAAMHRLDLPAVDGVASPRSEKMLTPNKTNFNFDAASPFLVNVTMRRKPNRAKPPNETNTSKLCRTISIDRDIVNQRVTQEPKAIEGSSPTPEYLLITSDEDDVVIVQENLFQLTESNLEKHLRSTPKPNRVSLVNSWRNKVNRSRRRESIVPADEIEFDSFILKHTSSLSTLSSSKVSTPLSNSSSVVTVVAAQNGDIPKENRNKKTKATTKTAVSLKSVDTGSFVTAVDANGVVTSGERNEAANGMLNANSTVQIIRSPDSSKIIVQLEEAYMHTDVENNIVFYEQKLLSNRMLRKSIKSSNADESEVGSGSCPETEYTIPLDYDTDELRKELTQFGEVPGPITKSTKRLYMKRLIKYKRKPTEAVVLNRGLGSKPTTSKCDLKWNKKKSK